MRTSPSLRHLLFKLTLVVLALFTLTIAMSPPASAQIRISVGFGPPALPIYEQPICPGDGYLWTPGYWAWDGDDYYWVPGTWVLAPEVDYLWTPPWWGWENGAFFFHDGWWGPHVGFYGGVVYGFGYFGVGFVGGRWDHDHFFYNREVTNINVVNIHNVYNETVINRYSENHISYNGGPGGIEARPRPEDERWDHERHIAPVAAQTRHIEEARGNRELRASANQGRPPIAATGRPGEFRGNVTPTREAGGEYHPPANRGGNELRGEGNMARPADHPSEVHPTAVHPKELPPFERPAAPNTGNASRDRKLQQQQDKMFAKQDKEREKLQQKQDQEHQRLQQQNANEARKQQTEQRHQQQTQQLQQRHVQQQQQMQQRAQPRRR